MRRYKGECKGLLPHITDWLEGDAGKSVCGRIERHLVGCETCRMYVDTHKRVIELYKKWRDEKLPIAVEIRLRKRLHALMASSGGGKQRPPGRVRRRTARPQKSR
jgi:hypothetical protein